MTELSPAAKLALLLTARWAVNGAKPLTNSEYREVRLWLGIGNDAAVELMNSQRTFDKCPIEQRRLSALLNRGLGVFQPVDRWMQAGLWVRTWADTDYPSRFKQLRLRAPALLFGYGNPDAFTEKALAIVGSRNASEERLSITAEVGQACARSSITVVSGGAKGVDAAAMNAGMAAGGTVVGVLADSLLRESGKKTYRDAILEHRLCLMSEVNPEARFDVGNAMARNRLAYACADAALIIECDPGKGGTWQGAMEARREGKTVYVLRGARAERQLAELGAVVIDTEFALQPMKLIRCIRPAVDQTGKTDLENWAQQLIGDEANADTLAMRIQSDARAIALRLIELCRPDQTPEIRLAASQQTPDIEEPAKIKTRRKPTRAKREGVTMSFEDLVTDSNQN
jgi:predicted Rossmann fold nucleotide-binding protein DprA/Smf involved in DNA uptake